MRSRDWEYTLVAYAQSQLERAFRWGETDCFSLVREALGVVYDPSPLGLVPYYLDGDSARLVLREVGNIAEALHELGAVCIPVTFAQQGDLVTMPGDDGDGLARFAVVVDGRGRVLTSSPHEGAHLIAVTDLPAGSLGWRWP